MAHELIIRDKLAQTLRSRGWKSINAFEPDERERPRSWIEVSRFDIIDAFLADNPTLDIYTKELAQALEDLGRIFPENP